MNKLAASILTYLAVLAALVLAINVSAEATPRHTPSAPASVDAGVDMETPATVRATIESHHFDLTGITILVTDDPMLNCGSAVSPAGIGGGCTIAGGHPGAILVVSPIADEHVILHEFAHARYGVGECAAERFANTALRAVEWSYPTCAYGVEPTTDAD